LAQSKLPIDGSTLQRSELTIRDRGRWRTDEQARYARTISKVTELAGKPPMIMPRALSPCSACAMGYTDDIVFRVAKLAATGTIAGCAASASDAIGKLAVPFAACYLGSLLILLALYVRAWRHVPEARPTIVVYLIIVSLSATLWAVSLVVPDAIRYAVWAIAVLVSAAGPVLATLRSDTAPLQVEHLPERFALLVILVLGEAVGGAARGVHDASWPPIAIAVGALAFAIAAGM
jgi:Bacterial low temperature requirement A protein (LtrA)